MIPVTPVAIIKKKKSQNRLIWFKEKNKGDLKITNNDIK